MLWDLNEGKHLYTLDGGDIINALCFSPNRYWLCAATGPSIKIWVRGSLVFIPPRPDPCGIPPKKTLLPSNLGFCWVWSHLRGADLPLRSQRWSSAGPVAPPGWVAHPKLVALSPSPAQGSHQRAVMKLQCHLTASLRKPRGCF